MEWLRIALLLVAVVAVVMLWRWGRGGRRARQASRRRPAPRGDAGVRARGDHLDRAENLAAAPPAVDVASEHPLERLLADVDAAPQRRRTRRRGEGGAAREERQMDLPLEAEAAGGEPEPRAAPAERPPPGERIIVLYVRAREAGPWEPEAVRDALQSVGLEFGPLQVFHHYGVGHLRAGEPLFSVANMFEPGSFDPQAPESFATRGLALFLRLPCAIDPLMAFELMLNTAQRLAEQLSGELLDGEREPLTAAAIGRLRELVLESVNDATG